MSVVLISRAGVLPVILNRPIGEAFRRVNLSPGDRDYGGWSYRAPVILVGVLLTCVSFLAE